LRGLGAEPQDTQRAPIIVRRTESEFLPALFAALSQKSDLSSLGLPNPGEADQFEGGTRRLFQPVHRSFNCVLFEACCHQPGFPRLDPRKIHSAGMVIRRVVSTTQPELDQAWLHHDGSILGWKSLPTGSDQLDPDPKLRVRSPLAVNRHLHLRLAELLTPVLDGVEPVTALFVAPPDVGEAAGRTILYGVVPVSSSEERSRSPVSSTKSTPEAANEDIVEESVVTATSPGFLRDLGQSYGEVLADQVITRETFAEAGGFLDSDFVGSLSTSQEVRRARKAFTSDLRMLATAWRLFDDAPEAQAVIAQLNRHQVKVAPVEAPNQYTWRPLGDYLKEAAQRLVFETGAQSVRFPKEWSQPSSTIVQGIRTAVAGWLTAQYRSVGIRLKRFDEPGALYRLHCFVRVRGEHDCPPELHWTTPSAVFTIVPWWESSGVPVHTISLPDLNPQNIRKLKPNVAFVVPPRLAAVLNLDSKTLIEGKDPGNPSIGIGWICSFSIPIITLCAFIVLNLFLSLFKLIFMFMFSFSLSLKVCLPFPKLNSRPRP
jgi:hypothetical protein